MTKDKKAALNVGDKVEANWKSHGSWYPGSVKRDHGDGIYDIDYNDGDKEMRVLADKIRLVNTQSVRTSALFYYTLIYSETLISELGTYYILANVYYLHTNYEIALGG